ncbi:DNA-damage inducible protein [Theileria orientalis strain Shintoku]|uniref:DNA-damage inducible protein n=1 Tax=Theileria orientalis strain Shintoku TaxID=869250 RepID=J4C354_THEOR|nr:DNA-damage inducible protein [Theileria orientalis strain Shintoku]BAM39846.1 DNA-damage inducible protein [Theileria orientalis strain Shintoku]|eukprot:XP_009690147.1 DNA-damage inducible protein [Theileria orientalis strain Shintoku]
MNELIKDNLNIPVENQRLYLDGNMLKGNYKSISDSGIKSGDVLLVKSERPGFDISSLLASDYDKVPEEALRQRAREIMQEFKPGSTFLNTLKLHNEPMYKALQANNEEEVYRIVKKEYEEVKKKELDHRKKLMKAYLDPLNPESQSLIHKEIEMNRINDNLISAQNYLPESFGKINMLYVKVEINNVVMKALVDTGAQSTIMSKECASRCNLLRLVDERFKSVAVGVGTMKTLGKIHLADMKIGTVFIPVSFIVIEEASLEFILGLDVLRRYTCDINLKKNYLGINDVNVPFMSEAEVGSFVSHTARRENPAPAAPTTPTGYANTAISANPDSLQSSAIDDKARRLSETLNITPEYARELLEIAGGDEQLAASYVT